MQIPRWRLSPPRARALVLVCAAAFGALVVVGSSSSTAAGVRVVGAAAQSAPSLAPAQLIGLSGALRRAKAPPEPAAPVIKTQPANAYAAPGSYAHFTAVVSGYPRPSAQWQRSDNRGASWRSIRGVHGYTLAFLAATSQNGDEFRAVFKNKRGKRTTAAAKLSVVAGYEAPLIESQPANLTVAAGTSATFTAVAHGDPAPNVQWQLSANGGATWSNVSGGTSQTLSFVASSILSGYEFRAQFTNVLGTALSSGSTLTVAGSAAGETPVVTEQPTGQDVPVGATNVTFTAAASGSPTPSVQWQVSTNSGQTWTAIPGATSPTYTITQATAGDDRNEYNAVFTNSAGMATTEPAILGVGYQLTSNWSGYAAAAPNNSTYSSVTASWTIPTFTCTPGSETDSSQWVGIDGYNDETVEQDGTFANCDGVHTTPNYGAWYELVGDDPADPNGQINFPNPVSPGDMMTATVSVDDDTGQWTFTVHDATAGWTAHAYVTWSGPARSSAEWIVERPELCNASGSSCDFATLANFGTVTMSNALATDGSGQQSAGVLGAIPLEMIRSASDSTLLAQPGSLDGTGEIFTDTWYHGS